MTKTTFSIEEQKSKQKNKTKCIVIKEKDYIVQVTKPPKIVIRYSPGAIELF